MSLSHEFEPALVQGPAFFIGPRTSAKGELTGSAFARTIPHKKWGEECLVYVFEFFETKPDGSRDLIDIQKHRAKSADAAAHRARTIIKNVVLVGRAANIASSGIRWAA